MTSAATDLVQARDGSVAVRSASGTLVAGRVRVATSFWARFRGLMGQRSLDQDEGLFLPDTSIHMMFMRFRIDALFVDAPDAAGDRRVVAVRPDLRPWRGLVMPVRGAAGVVELAAGRVAHTGVRIGDSVRFEQPPVR